MEKEILRAFHWLEHRHETMKMLAEHDKNTFQSDYGQAYATGMEATVKFYGEEIANIRQLLDGYLIDDVNLDGGEEHVG